MADGEPEDVAAALNAAGLDGWITAMGLRLIRATRDEVEAELTIGPQHRQAYGIVHGGVHAGIVETLASIGAALHALPEGRSVVGLENHTSFLRAVRSGRLRASARPLDRGRRTQVWECSIHDDEGRLCASGRVRLLALEPDAVLAGQRAAGPPA
ncbi:PaaI family thioesterase [Sorangium sp. So ce1036]|uniref:PaaI family thioesterase n=1 Tax=Sorangium sp. So ce1036 TaxID=3133328 RepID=UPI003F0D4F35